MLMRRYFAFILMLFTVVTNTAESHTAYAGTASSNVRLVFASKLNEIISSNIQKVNIAVKKQNTDRKSFGDLLDSHVDSSGFNPLICLVGVFVLCFLFINNGIVKNSIWKSTVF